MWKRLKRNPLSILGLALILLFAFIALAAPWLAPPEQFAYDPYLIPQKGYSLTPRPPGEGRPLGTTEQQYDLYYGLIWGSRTAFQVGLAVVVLSLFLGILVGSLAGYYGKWTDEILMRLVDVILAVPGLVLAVVIVSILGPGLIKVMVAIAAVNWPSYARLLRGDILSLKEREFVSAAKALGATDWAILTRHVLPNAIYPLLVIGSLDMGRIVVSAAALSFLGLGAPIGYADWGQLVALSRNWIIGSAGNPFQYWHTLLVPGGAIFLFVLGWNLLGDAFRDILDPKLN